MFTLKWRRHSEVVDTELENADGGGELENCPDDPEVGEFGGGAD
jgi:hypothetical protein